MYECIYVYIHICTHIFIYTYMYVYMHIFIYMNQFPSYKKLVCFFSTFIKREYTISNQLGILFHKLG